MAYGRYWHSRGNKVKPISSGEEYIESLRGRGLKVYLFGELVDEPVDHPMIRPSIKRGGQDLRPG